MPLQATSGAASYDAFGGGVPIVPNYIEEVFSTYLYTGTGASLTITNGIDLSGKGGLVWTKARSAALTSGHILTDTVRGAGNLLRTQTTNGNENDITALSAFNSTGFTLDTNGGCNNSGTTFASWSFREQAKFFDVVTYTGTGSNTTIAHNLGSVPGCIIIKRTSTGGTNWAVYHRSLANTEYILLNTTAAKATGATYWNSTTPTSTVFSLGTDAAVNGSGSSYVAYIFAHDAGGFGLTGTDNVISCGSFTTDGSGNATVSLGYEPQWLMVKDTTNAQNWYIEDNMRAFNLTARAILFPSLSNAEATGATAYLAPNSTGFAAVNGQLNASATYIYIAIRRGPMKVPTSGTSVFAPIAYAGTNTAGQVISGASFPPDLSIFQSRAGAGGAVGMFDDRLRGGTAYLPPSSTAAEGNTAGYYIRSFNMDGVTYGTAYLDYTNSAYNYINWMFRRAPSFFDEVCYTGTGSARTVEHNLGVAPELMIVKSRSLAQSGAVYTASTGNANYLRLFSTSSDSGETATSFWNSTTPTSSVFSLGTANNVNGSGQTYVAYLFSTCAGVSKVGSYTGTGSTQTINCGFTGGARFVLIKKSTSTAPDRDWYVWDTARGMVSGTDPSLKLNTTAAEVNANDVYTITTGFQLVSSSDYVNASGVTYIFLAIA